MSEDIVPAIFQAALSAMESYLECAGMRAREDDVSERSLSAIMALELHKICGLHACPEALYTRIVDDLHMMIDEAQRMLMDDLRADIALYENSQPVAVIELKILSDGKNALADFARDLLKGDPVRLSERLPIYAIALICQTESRTLDEQKAWVQRAIRPHLTYSRTVPTRTGEKWEWCFACAKREPARRSAVAAT